MSKSQMMGRTLARSQALQILFQAEATGRSVDDVLAGDYALSEGPLDPFGEMLARGAGSMEPTLDAIIDQVSDNWGVSRMASVDRNLLRLSIFEMLHVDEVAVAVTINESVLLAKAYGTDDSSKFVNGLLGRIARDTEAGIDVEAEAVERERASAAEADAEEAEAMQAEEAEATEAEEAEPSEAETAGTDEAPSAEASDEEA